MTIEAELDLSDVTREALATSLRNSIDLVASRLADPQQVAYIASRPDNKEPLFGSSMWAPVTLSHGWPGTAMFFAELSRQDPSWLRTADQHLRLAVNSLSDFDSNGLFAGPASVLSAALALQPHYGLLRERLAAWVAKDQLDRLADAQRRPAPGTSWNDYDTINGLGGTGRLLLAAEVSNNRQDPIVHEAVVKTLQHICSLTKSVRVDNKEVPGWWVSNELEPVDQDRLSYPRGDFNLGLAHGIAGPLAFLAQAIRVGYDHPSIRESIATVTSWLTGWRLHDQSGVYWPCRVSWDEELAHAAGVLTTVPFTRTAWCYGAPGVSAALNQAATATSNQALGSIALDATRATLRRPQDAWRIAGTTMCHGLSGVLTGALGVAGVAADPELAPRLRSLASELATAACADQPFGYVHEMPSTLAGWQHDSTPVLLDGAGLLEGAAGVGCALLMSKQVLVDQAPVDDRYDWRAPLMMG